MGGENIQTVHEALPFITRLCKGNKKWTGNVWGRGRKGFSCVGLSLRYGALEHTCRLRDMGDKNKSNGWSKLLKKVAEATTGREHRRRAYLWKVGGTLFQVEGGFQGKGKGEIFKPTASLSWWNMRQNDLQLEALERTWGGWWTPVSSSLRTAEQGRDPAKLETTDCLFFLFFHFLPFACLFDMLTLVVLSSKGWTKEESGNWKPNVTGHAGWPHLKISAQTLVGIENRVGDQNGLLDYHWTMSSFLLHHDP